VTGIDGSQRPSLANIQQPKIESVDNLPSVWDLSEEIDWVIEDFIPAKSITLISGESGIGKSWLAYAIAGAVANGREFAGLTVRRSMPALYLDGENPLAVVRRNVRDLAIPRTPTLNVWGGWNQSAPPGPADQRIENFVRGHFRSFLIYDSLVHFHTGDEQSSTETRRFLDQFRHLANLGATVVLLHHTGKAETSKLYRGSSDIQAAVDTAFVTTGQQRDGRLYRLTLKNFKSRIAPARDFGFQFQSGEGFQQFDIPNRRGPMEDVARLEQIVRENPESSGNTIIDLAQQQGLHLGKNRIRALLNQPPYLRLQGSRNTSLYCVADQPGIVAT
jgi:archaellum biogenesis ATPase FlaH